MVIHVPVSFINLYLQYIYIYIYIYISIVQPPTSKLKDIPVKKSTNQHYCGNIKCLKEEYHLTATTNKYGSTASRYSNNCTMCFQCVGTTTPWPSMRKVIRLLWCSGWSGRQLQQSNPKQLVISSLIQNSQHWIYWRHLWFESQCNYWLS
jgi:hypothetical protein